MIWEWNWLGEIDFEVRFGLWRILFFSVLINKLIWERRDDVSGYEEEEEIN